MPKQDFLPKTDGELQPWLDNFAARLPGLAAKYGLTEEEEPKEAVTHATGFRTATEAATAARTSAQSASRRRTTVRAAAVAFARELARRLKSHKAYEDADGSLLGIVGPEESGLLPTSRPAISVSLEAGLPRIQFVKARSDGINLYSRSEAEPTFTFLARDTMSPYLDTRPKPASAPERRFYQAFYVLRDREVGLASDIVEIVVP